MGFDYDEPSDRIDPLSAAEDDAMQMWSRPIKSVRRSTVDLPTEVEELVVYKQSPEILCDQCKAEHVVARFGYATEFAETSCHQCLMYTTCIDSLLYAWHQRYTEEHGNTNELELWDNWHYRKDLCRVIVLPKTVSKCRPGGTFQEVSLYKHDKAEGEPHAVFNMTIWTLEAPPPLLKGPVGYGSDLLQPSHPQLRRIQCWLQECENHHDDCGPRKKVRPRRLVDLRAVSTGTLFLIDNTDQDMSYPTYTTASYVWGQGNKMLACKDNYHTLKSGFPLQTLPASLRDIVLLTVSLGVRYIWIDGICIVQDDPADWGEQAAEMQNIYLGSFLTLIAATSSDCGQSLLTRFYDPEAADMIGGRSNDTRSYSRDLHVMTHAERWEGPAAELHIQGGDSTAERSTGDLSRRKNRTNVLEERAWCFQEYLLASRIVYFGSCMLEWDCKRETDDELGMPHQGYDRPYNTQFRTSFRAVLNKPPMILEDCTALWRGLLTNYTGLHLTFEKDRLAALSGISAIFKSWMPDTEFKAGLWTFEDLLWFAPPSGKPPRNDSGSYKVLFGSRKVPFQAPTWSWASVRLEVDRRQAHGAWGIKFPPGFDAEYYDSSEVISKAEVEAWQCTTSANGNPFVDFTGGTLSLSTRSFPAKLNVLPCPSDPEADAVVNLEVPDSLLPPSAANWDSDYVALHIDCWPAGETGLVRTHDVFCLLLCDTRIIRGAFNAFFMVCQRLEDHGAEYYERLGLFHCVTRNLQLDMVTGGRGEETSTSDFMGTLGYKEAQFCIR